MPKCYQSIVIQAPIETVWEKIRNFHDMSWNQEVITRCEAVGDKSGTEVGAKRILNDAFHETLLELNDTDHCMRYTIDDGPSPVSKEDVSDYIGTVQLYPVTMDNATFVAWFSTWRASDNAAADFCHPIYNALLQDLRLNLSPGQS